jgi:hypothetical protein
LKKFEFSHHALERIRERSTSKEEVIQAISESEWFRAEKNRYSCSKAFAYDNHHYGKFYKWKDIVPIFVE